MTIEDEILERIYGKYHPAMTQYLADLAAGKGLLAVYSFPRGEMNISVRDFLHDYKIDFERLEKGVKQLWAEGAIKNFRFYNDGSRGNVCTITVPDDFENAYKLYKLHHKNDVGGVDRGAREKTSLGSQSITFDEKSGRILIGEIPIQLPPFQNEHCLCRVIFKRNIHESVDWSLVYEEMTGNPDGIPDKKKMRPVQDAMYAVNNRVKKEANTDDSLFLWKGKSIARNF